ncbi:MAG: YggT family protein [Candidatus Omnitrophica bacterium]|nr:YggT family protein [Candidatus Omnitrophota bacterium]
MFILGNFIFSIARLLDILITLLYWLIIIRALVSWVNPDPFNPIVQFLQRATDPILNPIRKALRLQFFAFDLSPIIAILCLIFLQSFLVRTLTDLATRLR